MPLEVEVIYENGVLKPNRPLPFAEHQKVTIVIPEQKSITDQIYGIMGWKGDSETVQKFALDPELIAEESP